MKYSKNHLKRLIILTCYITTIILYGFKIPVTASTHEYDPPIEALNNHLTQRFAIESKVFLTRSQAKLINPKKVVEFYQTRSFKLAWIEGNTHWKNAKIMLDTIFPANNLGLNPEHYHLQAVHDLLSIETPINTKIYFDVLIDLEILLTDASLRYMEHSIYGQLNQKEKNSEWFPNRPSTNFINLLNQAINQNILHETLNTIEPMYPGYHKLKQSLADYKTLATMGNWPTIIKQSQYGDQGEHIELLVNRLMISGDYKKKWLPDPVWYEHNLVTAVKQFQHRHGLEENGIVDDATIAALNIPIEDKINQLRINLERWRWLPQSLGKQYIVVNIANFQLQYIANEKVRLTSNVIVGRTYRRTPIFSREMKYLVLNPSWNVPHRLARADVLPKIIKNTDYLTKKRFMVLDRKNAAVIDPATINWQTYKTKSFPYQLRQRPGASNSLGKIKFMLPNRYNVYLHDTPKRSLFNKVQRTFSSGCVRVEKPLELASIILSDHPNWTKEAIQMKINSGRQKVIQLLDPIPVHILYWTSWVDDQGLVHFRHDIYNHDEQINALLH